MSELPRLLLFDIDGTLVSRASGEHKDALHVVLRERFGLSEPEALRVESVAGRTDRDIARELMAVGGFTRARIDEVLDELDAAWIAEYERLCPADLSDHLVPGIADLLAELGARDDVRLALLTGNLEPIARRKLGAAGIGHHFEPGQGAFGSDHLERERLPPVARARAGAPGDPWPRERTLVIGDTPRDIACARADGIGCFAVTSGPYDAAALMAADAIAADSGELRALLLSP